MDRRRFLQATGSGALIAIAGCMGGDGGNGGGGGDSGPKYSQNNKDALVMPVEEFDEGWYEHPNMNEEADMAYGDAETDEAMEAFSLLFITVFKDSEAASNALDEVRNRVAEPNDFNLRKSNDSFWADEQQYSDVYFQDSNATAQITSSRTANMEWQPYRSQSMDFAEVLYDYW